MKRIYESFAYGDGPIAERYWDTTVDAKPNFPPLEGDVSCELAIIGGGYTGLSAAIALAKEGVRVVVLDAKPVGWGASGRNGGLVSAGSAKLDDAAISKHFGSIDAQTFFDAEKQAVALVEHLLEEHGIDADRHSNGYTCVAHSPRHLAGLKDYGEQYSKRYGLPFEYLDQSEMVGQGLNSPDFFGAVHLPLGLALNPLKFVLGLATTAEKAGATLAYSTEITSIASSSGYELRHSRGTIRCKKLIVATNGYTSDDMPKANASRYLPVQSNILVSRQLTEEEIEAQGWWSRQMVCDTRNLLHYFRLLPDNRMLLGLRGSINATPENLAAMRKVARSDFDRMFPAWQHVETPFFWSGLICMTRNLVPFCGPLHGLDDAWGAFGYHGSGVTMGPYAGQLLANMVLGKSTLPHPDFMKTTPRKFEFGPLRRNLLAPVFSWYKLVDKF
ncbi:FAD-binding oxidoreductase [Rhodobacteraceae bacterium RKSG542]|uniref:NAD(P)/FAD-dependent oxidoreductase n=1 Tax=Pseudovibrio flavus TaxID=2529854 RepID=UPI0012BBADF6|nr:FAD-binding oxidoreductase [Pseudovibrio flavus]MTI18232.1 FAD-binding oxidoreductase [Pseudovibrio flavus]